IRATAVEVDRAALCENARLIGGLTATQVVAVVKADGYGHGAPDVALTLEAAGAVAGFAVSLVEEGVQLRDAGVRLPVLVMGPSQAGGHDEMIGRGLTPVVSDPGELHALTAIARVRARRLAVHLKVDTGMSRLGVAPERAPGLIASARANGVDIAGLMTHLANADVDDPDDPDCFTWAQLGRFSEVVDAVGEVPGLVRHAANSSGAMLFPAARLDQVRVGLALYGNGAWASDGLLPAPRRQVLRLVSHVAQLRQVEAGARVGYGGLWTAARPTRAAVLPLGYADGLPRRVTGQGAAIIAGRRCPLIGAVSMDIVIADVTDLPGVEVGDEAVLIGHGEGRFGSDLISTAEVARWAGVTEYEVTCGLSKRVPRVYR
ncbi:MAG TPA: alanine racemase, partial [Kofleriaceae bacterium]|nr:alanine racemase [Kofleriaceae bacterium]